MDMVFYNGRVCALDNARNVFQAVGVKRGRIEALGTDEQVRALAGPKAEAIDLKGSCLFPGFIDSHNHLSWVGYLSGGLELSPPAVGSIEDILGLVKEQAAKLPPGSWIAGSRYAEFNLSERRHPTRHDLDPISPDHPVILYHTSFHACVLNSLALAELGFTEASQAPVGGVIERDPDGKGLSGVFHDAAMMDILKGLYQRDVEAMSPEERVALAEAASLAFARRGVVMTHDAMVTPLSLEMYQMAKAAGRLKVRVYAMNLEDNCAPLVEAGIRTGFGDGRLRIGPIKIFHDGGISNRTAAVSEPYLTPPHDHGLTLRTGQELSDMVVKYHKLGYQLAIHCQGDVGLVEVLDAYQAALGPDSDNPLRHRVEHAGCLWPELLARARRMNILMAVQPHFVGELGDGIIEAFGPERAGCVMPFKDMLAAGLVLGAGSDCPVVALDPRLGLKDAVTRLTDHGQPLGQDQVLSMDQALKLYTAGSAYFSFDEKVGGTIELGKRADFTGLGEDPRLVEPSEVPDIPVVMTVVGGEIVHHDL